MSLIDRLPSWITGRRRATASREEVLRALPLRNPNVQYERNEQGEMVLSVPLAKGRVIKGLKWFLPAPDRKQILLDEIGADIWELCDGTNTVEGIRRRLSEKYRLERREAEASLMEYLRMLAKRSLVVAMGQSPGEQGSAVANPQAQRTSKAKASVSKKQGRRR
jgi:hypothetical protein